MVLARFYFYSIVVANIIEQDYELSIILRDTVITPFVTNKYVWTPSVDETFSFISCYATLCVTKVNDQCDAATFEAVSRIWKRNVSSKIKVFTWRLMFNRIPTQDQLATRVILINSHDKVCAICFEVDETLINLFFHCKFGVKV